MNAITEIQHEGLTDREIIGDEVKTFVQNFWQSVPPADQDPRHQNARKMAFGAVGKLQDLLYIRGYINQPHDKALVDSSEHVFKKIDFMVNRNGMFVNLIDLLDGYIKNRLNSGALQFDPIGGRQGMTPVSKWIADIHLMKNLDQRSSYTAKPALAQNIEKPRVVAFTPRTHQPSAAVTPDHVAQVIPVGLAGAASPAVEQQPVVSEEDWRARLAELGDTIPSYLFDAPQPAQRVRPEPVTLDQITMPDDSDNIDWNAVLASLPPQNETAEEPQQEQVNGTPIAEELESDMAAYETERAEAEVDSAAADAETIIETDAHDAAPIAEPELTDAERLTNAIAEIQAVNAQYARAPESETALDTAVEEAVEIQTSDVAAEREEREAALSEDLSGDEAGLSEEALSAEVQQALENIDFNFEPELEAAAPAEITADAAAPLDDNRAAIAYAEEKEISDNKTVAAFAADLAAAETLDVEQAQRLIDRSVETLVSLNEALPADGPELTLDDVADKFEAAALTVEETNAEIERGAEAEADIDAGIAGLDFDFDAEFSKIINQVALEKEDAQTQDHGQPVALDLFAPSQAAIAYAERKDKTTLDDDNSEEALSARALLARIHAKSPLWDQAGSPDMSTIKPKKGLFGALTWSAVGSFAASTALTGIARWGATGLLASAGMAALPAGIAAGIAVAAGRAFYANRQEIFREMDKADSYLGKAGVLTSGFFRSMSLTQWGVTIAAGVGGAYAGQFVANNAEAIAERLAEGVTYVRGVVDSMIANPSQYLPDISLSQTPVSADVSAVPADEIQPRVVKTVTITPSDLESQRLAELFGGEATPPAGDDLKVVVAEDVKPVTVDTVATVSETTPVKAETQLPVASATAADAVSVAAGEVAQPVTTPDTHVVTAETADVAQPSAVTPEVVVGQDVTAAQPEAAIDDKTATGTPGVIETRTHVVARGDNSLWKIAQEAFGVKGEATRDAVEAIIAANPELAANPGKLSLGQELIIPVQLEGAPQAECKWSRRAVTCVIPGP